MIVDDTTRRAFDRIFPLLPWALRRMQGEIDGGIFSDMEPGTRAAVAHDLIMKEGERRFTDPSDILVSNASGLLHFVLPTALLRVKRGDARSLSITTNPTKQTLAWTHQLALAGIADPRHYFHMVYAPDPFWTAIARCIVGAYHGNRPVTWYEVDVDDWYDSGGAAVDLFAPEPALPSLKLKPGAIPLPLEENDGTS